LLDDIKQQERERAAELELIFRRSGPSCSELYAKVMGVPLTTELTGLEPRDSPKQIARNGTVFVEAALEPVELSLVCD